MSVRGWLTALSAQQLAHRENADILVRVVVFFARAI